MSSDRFEIRKTFPELKEKEGDFVCGTRLVTDWDGYDPRTSQPVKEVKSLQRSMLLTYCSIVGKQLDLSECRALEIGVEKHRNVCMALGLKDWERLDRLDDVGGNKTDYSFDFVGGRIPDKLLGVFDVVVCSNALEHTFDIVKGFKRVFSLARPGGLVYISTPFSIGVHGLPDYWRLTPQAYEKILPEHTSEFIILDETWKGKLCGVSSFSVKP